MCKTLSALMALSLSVLLGACSKPVVQDEYVEIQPNETAWLIPLDGNTKESQKMLNSLDYLENNKVQLKRVIIPHELVDTCPTSTQHCYADMPKARLVRVSRSPTSREWTALPSTGTSAKNQAFKVESVESIDFTIGSTATAHVAEEGTAKFLYNYAGKPLSEVLDENVRSFISSHLSDEFGSRTLDEARAQKVAIFHKVFELAKAEFSAKGVTLDNFGFTEGMNYTDSRIQDAINKKFEADMMKQTAQAQAEAAAKFAAAKDAINSMQELEMKKKLVDAQVAMMGKWDGHSLPQVLAGDNIFAAMFAGRAVQPAK